MEIDAMFKKLNKIDELNTRIERLRSDLDDLVVESAQIDILHEAFKNEQDARVELGKRVDRLENIHRQNAYECPGMDRRKYNRRRIGGDSFYRLSPHLEEIRATRRYGMFLHWIKWLAEDLCPEELNSLRNWIEERLSDESRK